MTKMNLYIRVENEQAVEHPAMEENLLEAFGSIPSNWQPFTRVAKPTPGIYQVLDSTEPTYQKVNDVWRDVWSLRDMTEDEKSAVQTAVKTAWAASPNVSNYTAWTYDETTNSYQPPVAMPAEAAPEGQVYRWQGSTNSWQLAPVRPQDEQQYKWDWATWSWQAA